MKKTLALFKDLACCLYRSSYVCWEWKATKERVCGKP